MSSNQEHHLSWKKVFQYGWRALLLRCPMCGKSPMFIPLLKIRRLKDWFLPLDGCPRCGYPYEREPGYFLMATWAINYGIGSLLGIVIYLFLEWKYDLPIQWLLTWVMLPIILFNLLFVRHSKAFFLAIDLLCDPHEKEGEDEGGGPEQKKPSLPMDIPQGGASLPQLPLAPVADPITDPVAPALVPVGELQ